MFYRSYPYAYFRITGARRASALASYTFVYARVLQRLGNGDSIRSCDNSHRCRYPRHFGSVAGMPGRGGIMGLYITGNFYGTRNGIIGFKFDVANGTQYGWARIVVPSRSIVTATRLRITPGLTLAKELWRANAVPLSWVQYLRLVHSACLLPGARGLELWRRLRSETAHYWLK